MQNRHRHLNINRNPLPSSVVVSKYKTLLIGESLLNRINTRSNEKGVQKYSKNGARVSDNVDEIKSYKMKSFQTLIVSVEGNDASSKTDIELFEENYDKLISLVKTENPDCALYMCNISPRSDADVRSYNARILQLANTKSRSLKNQRVSSMAEMVSLHLAILEMMAYIVKFWHQAIITRD